MKSFLRIVLLGMVVLFGIGGCSRRPAAKSPDPAVIMEVLDRSLVPFEGMWELEIGRRFDHAVGVLVHGGDFVEGQWVAGASLQPGQHVTPMTEIVAKYQAKYPDRTIVLIACNTGHLKLGIPGVYYAKSSVWCVPDRAITPEMYTSGIATRTLSDGDSPFEFNDPTVPQKTRWEIDPDLVGNIFEMVCD